jgi:hypothetical protein
MKLGPDPIFTPTHTAGQAGSGTLRAGHVPEYSEYTAKAAGFSSSGYSEYSIKHVRIAPLAGQWLVRCGHFALRSSAAGRQPLATSH